MDAIVSKYRLGITIDLERNGGDGSADADPWLRFETIFEPGTIGGLKIDGGSFTSPNPGINGLHAADDAVLSLSSAELKALIESFAAAPRVNSIPSTTGSTL